MGLSDIPAAAGRPLPPESIGTRFGGPFLGALVGLALGLVIGRPAPLIVLVSIGLAMGAASRRNAVLSGGRAATVASEAIPIVSALVFAFGSEYGQVSPAEVLGGAAAGIMGGSIASLALLRLLARPPAGTYMAAVAGEVFPTTSRASSALLGTVITSLVVEALFGAFMLSFAAQWTAYGFASTLVRAREWWKLPATIAAVLSVVAIVVWFLGQSREPSRSDWSRFPAPQPLPSELLFQRRTPGCGLVRTCSPRTPRPTASADF